MKRIALLVAALAASLALVAQTGAMAHPKLTGTVGPGFTITLKDSHGKKVTSVKAGTYTVAVSDKSPIHNFHLTGSGVNKEITSVPFVGSKSATVTFKKGKTYTYVCDPHRTTMKGSFKAT